MEAVTAYRMANGRIMLQGNGFTLRCVHCASVYTLTHDGKCILLGRKELPQEKGRPLAPADGGGRDGGALGELVTTFLP